MSQHKAHVSWKRSSADFIYDTFSRDHTIDYPGGVSVSSSAATEFKGNSKYTNPEEMLAAAVASCHMLTFLAIAAKSKLIVDEYEDHPVATLEKNDSGQLAVTKITLSPRIRFHEPESISVDKLASLHEKAHRNCFIANSLKCQVTWGI